MKNNRIYYRNPFFHLGHLQTLFTNDEFATSNKGKCYMLLDDRYSDSRSSIEEDITYLGLKSTVIISISKYDNIINSETKKIVATGKLYMLIGKNKITNPAQISSYIDSCSTYFQLRLTESDTTIGFVKRNENGQLKLIYILEYIVKICDIIFNITDVTYDLPETFKINTQTLNFLPFKEYIIEDFKYSKKHWTQETLSDPCLLTLKGLKNRGIPSCVLWDFYQYAVNQSRVTLFDFEKILITYLHTVAVPLTVIIDPLLFEFNNDDRIYINRSDVGLDCQHLKKNHIFKLNDSSDLVKCTDFEMTKIGIQALQGKRLQAGQAGQTGQEGNPSGGTSLNWLPDDSTVHHGVLRVHNWFYTGLNDVIPPIVQPIVYTHHGIIPDRIYYIKDWGFITYRNNKEFISICKE